MNKTILITSHRNNIGKSLFSIKLANEYSDQGFKTVLIDATASNKSVVEYLDMDENVIYDLVDVVGNTCDIDQSIINVNEKFDIIPTPRLREKINNINKDSFTKFVEDLEKEYEKVIIEINGISNSYFVDLKLADSVIIMNNNEFSSLNQINSDYTLCRENNIEDSHILINMYNKKDAKRGVAFNKKDFIKLFPSNSIDIVNYDDKYNSYNSEYILKKYEDELCKTVNSFTKKIV